MNKSKEEQFTCNNTFNLLKVFTGTEMREFGKFVHSPFHNNRKEVKRYFDEIEKFYPEFSDGLLTKQNIFLSLYPGKVYRDDVIRRLSSNLLKLAEEYLAYKTYRQDEFNFNKNLLEQYYERDMDRSYDKQYIKTMQYLEKNKLRNAEYYYKVNLVEDTNRYHLAKKDTTAKNLSAQSQIDSVWQYSVITLLRLYINAVQYVDQFNSKHDLSNLKLLLGIAENSKFKKSKAAEMFYHSYRLMRDSRNDDTFNKLKNMMNTSRSLLDNTEKDMLYISLLTYCWESNVAKGRDYSKDEFLIIKEMLEEGILSDGKRIYPEWFMYAFLTATKAGEIDFAEKFIDEYKNQLPEKERKNVVNHARAELEMVKKNYEKALKFLAVPRYNNVSEKLRANNMYLKIYYELNRSEQFFYNVDSFKHLMDKETSLSRPLKNTRSNFVKYLTRIYKFRLGEKNTDLQKLRKEIETTNTIHKKWLVEKIDEIKQ